MYHVCLKPHVVFIWIKTIATIYYLICYRHCCSFYLMYPYHNLMAIFLLCVNEEIEAETLHNLLKITQLANAKSYMALKSLPSPLPSLLPIWKTANLPFYTERPLVAQSQAARPCSSLCSSLCSSVRGALPHALEQV